MPLPASDIDGATALVFIRRYLNQLRLAALLKELFEEGDAPTAAGARAAALG